MTTSHFTGLCQACPVTTHGQRRGLSARPVSPGHRLSGAGRPTGLHRWLVTTVPTAAALGMALSGAFPASAGAATVSHAGGPGMLSPPGGPSVTNIRFTGNSFRTYAAARAGRHGVWFSRPAWAPCQGGPADGWHRSGNTVLATGESVDGGNPHGAGVLCQ